MAYLRTIIVHVARDATFSRMTKFPARTLILTVTAPRAETNFVALAGTVAGNHRLRAADQRVPVVIRRAAALRHVIDHAAPCTLSARLAALAWICENQ